MKLKALFAVSVLLAGISVMLVADLADTPAEAQPTRAVIADKTMGIGLYALSIGNFEFTKGTYTMDFYVQFKWSDKTLSPNAFEFMNGRASSKEKIYENYTDTTSEVWYRVQANLFITPEFKNYPFDTQTLLIVIEDSKLNISNLKYTILEDVSGVDGQLSISGWSMDQFKVSVKEHQYPWGEVYSQFVFSVKLSRNTGPTVLKIMLPPIIFCLVSGLSFFFKADKITHRLGLGTSMLISAVMFHLSQTASLPALPYLILIDKIMISVYAFLACSLLATAIIYIDDEYWKEVDYTKIVNRGGAAITIILPFIVFGLLYFT